MAVVAAVRPRPRVEQWLNWGTGASESCHQRHGDCRWSWEPQGESRCTRTRRLPGEHCVYKAAKFTCLSCDQLLSNKVCQAVKYGCTHVVVCYVEIVVEMFMGCLSIDALSTMFIYEHYVIKTTWPLPDQYFSMFLLLRKHLEAGIWIYDRLSNSLAWTARHINRRYHKMLHY